MENTKDTIVYTFGRFQPPTSGHQLLIDKVISVAKKQGAEHRIYPSVSNDPKKNPLSHTDKVKFMKQMFKKANIVNDKKIITPFHAAKQLSDQGYKNVILVVGGDRVADLRKQISQYINHKDPKKAFYFDSFKVVSAGKRDPDSSDISGMSASKMRKAVSDKDFDLFMKGMPDSVSKTAAKKLYNAIAKGMNLKEDRDYKDEYEKHHASPEQRARRISRTVTRKKAEREGRVSKGDGKDIDHKDHNPHNDSPSNLRIKSKSSNRSDNGHNPGEKQKQHEETEVDELTIQQRLKMSRTAKRTAKKRLKTRMRKKKLRKGAAEIKKKAGKEALNTLKKKFAKGKKYADLSHSEKEKIDAKIKKFPKKRIEALTKKMLKVAKEKEKNRLKSLRGVDTKENVEGSRPEDREIGTDSLRDYYVDKTPGQKKIKSFKEACWDTHVQKGMKKKGNKMVPNCVPKNENLDEYRRKDVYAIVNKKGKVVSANLTKQNSEKEISRHRDATIILDPDAKVGDIQKYFARKESVELGEVSPPGFEGTVKAMKKHKEIDNPYALAWYMKNKGFKSHKKKDGSDKEKK